MDFLFSRGIPGASAESNLRPLGLHPIFDSKLSGHRVAVPLQTRKISHLRVNTAVPEVEGRSTDSLSVVCFGASSGGFEAYCKILLLLPADTGMAYVIVHHQPMEGKMLLLRILSRLTKMPVVKIAEGKPVQADHVYIVPPGMQVRLDKDVFRLSPLTKAPGWPKNISIFLQSLAEDERKRAIAVILSGFDSDGAAALQAIKDSGGLVLAQDFKTARHPDMPKSAVETGCVDHLLSPEGIAAKLRDIAQARGEFSTRRRLLSALKHNEGPLPFQN